jgi:hypothetical protein
MIEKIQTPSMNKYPKIALLFLLLLLISILGLMNRPHVKIDRVYWTNDGSALVVDARTMRCSFCGNIEVNGELNKRIVPNREDGTFTVTIPKQELRESFVKIDAYSEAKYFGGYIRSGRVRVPPPSVRSGR